MSRMNANEAKQVFNKATIPSLYKYIWQHFEPHALLEELIKSGEHQVADKVIYAPNECNCYDAGELVLPESYRRRELWFEMIFLDGSGIYNCAVIRYRKEAGPFVATGRGGQCDASSKNPLVLLDNIETMKEPQGMVSMPSDLWLKPLHEFSSLLRDMPNHLLDRVGIPSVDVLANGEPGTSIRRVMPSIPGELPGEMVQTGSHVVDCVSGQEANTRRREVSELPLPHNMPLRIGIFHGAYAVAFLEGVNLFGEGFQVTPRPFELEPWPIKRWHRLYYEYAKKRPPTKFRNATNLEGAQDSEWSGGLR